MRAASIGVCLFVAAVVASASSNAATPQLPQAEYKPLPVGTVIEYDTWKCEVVRSEEFITDCRDPDSRSRTKFAGLLVPYGSVEKAPPLGLQLPVMWLYDGAWEGILKTRRIKLSSQQISSIAALWPLTVGKSVDYKPKYDLEAGGTDVAAAANLRVDRIEQVSIGGRDHLTYVIVEDVKRLITSTYVASRDKFRRTLWFAPALAAR